MNLYHTNNDYFSTCGDPILKKGNVSNHVFTFSSQSVQCTPGDGNLIQRPLMQTAHFKKWSHILLNSLCIAAGCMSFCPSVRPSVLSVRLSIRQSVCMCVCLSLFACRSVGLSVGLSVTNIRGKRMNLFIWHFQHSSGMVKETIWNILGMVY